MKQISVIMMYAILIAFIFPFSAIAKENSIQAVTLKEITFKDTAEIYEISIQIPQLSGLKDKLFEKQFNDMIVKHALKEKEQFTQQAKETAEILKEHDVDFQGNLTITNDVIQTGSALSVLIETYSFTGGAHGDTKVEYYNFMNTKDARLLQLGDLFKKDADYINVINDIISKQIEERTAKGEMFFEGELGFQTIHDDQNFYFTEEGLVIAFEKYEIAPGAAGLPEFLIPYELIENMLKPNIIKQLNI